MQKKKKTCKIPALIFFGVQLGDCSNEAIKLHREPRFVFMENVVLFVLIQKFPVGHATPLH